MSGPRIIVLTAPSGSGKTTIARRLVEAIPQLRFSVSATTRAPRRHERDGVDYYFVTQQHFQELQQNGELVEQEEVYPGLYYGTLHSEIDRATPDQPVLLDIDVRGAESVKQQYGRDALILFIRPPSVSTLEERLRRRGTESDASLQARLARAREEMKHEAGFDHVVINDRLEDAVAETIDIVHRFLAVSAGNDQRQS